MNPVISIKKESAWKYRDSQSLGLSLGLSLSGGQIVLESPSGVQTTFTYGGAGAGLSKGLKLPKIGKVAIDTPRGDLTGTVDLPKIPSYGKLYITDGFKGDELTIADIRGPCAFVEAGGGLIAGVSGVAMLLDLDIWWLGGIGAPVLSSWATSKFLQSASAVLVMGGVNAGIQAQIGMTASLGYIH